MNKLMNKFKIGTKIRFAFILVILGIVIMAGITIVAVNNSTIESSELSDLYMPSMILTTEIETEVNTISIGLTDYRYTKSNDEYNLVEVAIAELEESINAMVTLSEEQEDERLIEVVVKLQTYADSLSVMLEDTKVSAEQISLNEIAIDEATTALEAQLSEFTIAVLSKLVDFAKLDVTNANLVDGRQILLFAINEVSSEVDNFKTTNLKSQLDFDVTALEEQLSGFDVIESKINEINMMVLTPTDKELLENVEKKVEVYKEIMLLYVDNEKVLQSLLDGQQEVVTELLNVSKELTNGAVVATTNNGISIKETLVQLRNLISIIVLIVLVFSIVITFVIIRTITKPINQLVRVADELSNGNLGVEQVHNQSRDEIGVLTRAFNKMHDNLRSLITSIHESSNKVGMTADQLNFNASEATKVTEEVAKTVAEVAEGATRQAMDTADASIKMNELALSIQKNTEGATALYKNSEAIENLANEGIETIEELTIKTEHSKNAMVNIFDVISLTNQSASRIGDASQMISSIADQTNLLALNAAIEAARAGEAGKGFAVVADEIRKLAEESAKSTSQIDNMLRELVNNANKAIKTSDEVQVIINDQAASVVSTKNKYDMIAKAIHQSTLEIEKIAKLGDQMEENRVEVVQVVESLAAIAEENAASTEETSASAEEMLSTMEEVTSASEILNSLSEELREEISSFTL